MHDLGEDIAQQGIDAQHEELGAKLLKGMFPEAILEPIRLHVAAKRYLCWKEPAYAEGLSASSALSLKLQGGPMTDSEATAFASLPHYMPLFWFAVMMTWVRSPACRPRRSKAIAS